MLLATRIAQVLIRALGVTMLVLGTLFWTGNALTLLPVHMLLGLALVLTLWTLAALAARARVHSGLVLLAAVWGLIVPALGMTQSSLLVGPAHWLIQVLHLLVGVTAIALGETMARQAKNRLMTTPRRVTATTPSPGW